MTLLGFGDAHPDYSVRVLNEREVRAAAGILLFLGMIAFLTTFHTGDFTLTRLMIIAFGLDFAIRLFISPAWSPAMILGRWIVRKQEPELTGAPQKRFAWALGLAIALVMAIWTMGLNLSGPVAVLGCLTCIVLLLLESAFGICVGCAIYNRIWPGVAQHCPGGVCEVRPRSAMTFVRPAQLAVLALFAVAIGVAAPRVAALDAPLMPGMRAAADDPARCEVPQFARLIGHEEMWRRHNNCL